MVEVEPSKSIKIDMEFGGQCIAHTLFSNSHEIVQVNKNLVFKA